MLHARKEILSRQLEGEVRAFADRAGGLLDRCVDYGTHVIPWMNESSRAQSELGHISVIQLTLHAVEALDAAAILLRRGAADPSQGALRSMMEASLSIEFILAADTVRRALAYQAGHAHARIENYRRQDPTTEAGKQLRAILAKDTMVGGASFVRFDTTAQIANLEKMLARTEFLEIEQEWQAMKTATGRKPPAWHALFGGPRDIQGLASTLGRHAWYELLYRDFSTEVHSSNAMLSLCVNIDGRAQYQPLRYPAMLPKYTELAVAMALHLYAVLIRFYCPERLKDFTTWHVQYVQKDFEAIGHTRLVDADRRRGTPVVRPA